MELPCDKIMFWSFLIWSLPMSIYRSRFRKLVYRTDDWKINIKPVFGKELKALFGNSFPEDEEYLSLRNFYRFYLLVYLILFIAWQLSK